MIGPNTEVRVSRAPSGDKCRIVVRGQLVTIGGPGEPVIITSDDATPLAGYWGQIVYEATTPDGRLDLDNGRYLAGNLLYRTHLSYGGANDAGVLRGDGRHTTRVALIRVVATHHAYYAVWLDGPTLVVSSTIAHGERGLQVLNAAIFDSVLRDLGEVALAISGGGRANVVRSRIEDNRYGIRGGYGTQPVLYLEDSVVTRVTEYAIEDCDGEVRSSTITRNGGRFWVHGMRFIDSVVTDNLDQKAAEGFFNSLVAGNGGYVKAGPTAADSAATLAPSRCATPWGTHSSRTPPPRIPSSTRARTSKASRPGANRWSTTSSEAI